MIMQEGKYYKHPDKFEMNMHPETSDSSSVLTSLKTVHETLSQERQKLQEVWETNNIHQSNTLAEVSFMLHLLSGSSGSLFPCGF